jgi:hypothetical protein
MKVHQLVSVVAASLWLLSAGIAAAQQADPQAQFNRAVELATAGDYVRVVETCMDVIKKLPESERPRVHKLLGYSYKKLDVLPESWHHLTTYLESSGKEDTSAGGWLQEVETALKKTHVKVTLTCSPPDAVLVMSSSLPCPVVWWFLPGKHQVVAKAPGYKPQTVDVDVRERGDSGVREIRLAAVTPEKLPEPVKASTDHSGTTIVSKPVETRKSSRALEWALIGSGLALGATGGIFHGLGYSKNEALHDKYADTDAYPDGAAAKTFYDDAKAEEVRPKELAAYVLYGVGGAALVAGIITWAVRKPGGDQNSAAFSISPLAMPGGSGAMMTFGF